MTNPNLYLALYDGSTRLLLSPSNSRYMLARNGWAPNAPGLRRGAKGLYGPYEELVEELEINVLGATPAECYQNYAELGRMMDQAERFATQRNVGPVILEYSPSGAGISSQANPLQLLLLGRAPGDQSLGAQVPVTFHETGRTYMIRGVRLRARRIGPMLHTARTAASAATTNGDVATVTMPSALSYYGPTVLTVSNVYMHGYAGPTFIVVVNDPSQVLVTPAESVATGGLFTSVNDSARYARDTNILRYTPTDTNQHNTNTTSGVGFSAPRLCAHLANIRNNSATTSFRLRLGVVSDSLTYTRPIFIAANATRPTWHLLGITAQDRDVGHNFQLLVQASAASGSLDIDSFVRVDLDDPGNAIFGVELASATFASQLLTIDHRLLSDRTPRVSVPGWAVAYYGWPRLFTRGGSLGCLLLTTGYNGSYDSWRHQNAGTPTTNVWTATRMDSYLTPR